MILPLDRPPDGSKYVTIPTLPLQSETNGKDSQNHNCNDKRNITCAGRSKCRSYFAVCDDHKKLTVWRCKNWDEYYRQFSLPTRANALCFDNGSTAILVADKSGDVLSFDLTSEKDSYTCILGHLSMLLDVTISPGGEYIITCDRDEKIRVSHYPNAYNIHCYCLGHTDFVSCLEIPYEFSGKYLISGSGGSTIRIWDYLKGKELDMVNCTQDAGLELLEIEETPETDLKIKRSQYPAVLSLRLMNTYFCVTMENYKGILIYNYSDSLSVPDIARLPGRITQPPRVHEWGPKLKLVMKIPLDHFVWDLHYLTPYPASPWMPQRIVILQASKEKPILKFKLTYDPDREDLNFQEKVEVNLDQDFFEDALITPDSSSAFAKELHKRLIDNVKEYMERKRERIDVSDNPAKKLKSS